MAVTIHQQLIRSLAESGFKPTLVTDALIDMTLERHARMLPDGPKIKAFREEDERNGQPWNGDVA